MALLSVAVVSLNSTHGHIGVQLQPLPPSYEALENMRQLLPPSPSPFQLPALWARRK